ncbi:DNA-J related domain-containing protein [Motilimonas eburnea]|uniref:DNA-J related domain-containing protein n=1 Tax=Motilimonas eburnea TaxID=1737488 RepID=UPI001E2B5BC6|nr:DNA-J related domain-containing protein [Motilimonas eburnea]MCE2571383.1 DnaJ domain-containing protein [Motilimonas eburnea]
MDNPLIDPLFELLISEPGPFKIHQLAQLIKPLRQTQLDADANLHLYKLNFLIMNALFQLKQELADDYELLISSLHIELVARSPKQLLAQQGEPSLQTGLQAFYLDWQNYQATKAEVDALLNQFWQALQAPRATAECSRQQALAIFELPPNASALQIKRRWRQLALRHHPDRSQEPAANFQRYLAAWQVLKCNHDCIS